MSSDAGPVGEAVADDRRDDAAEVEAAFDADVEHAGAEGDRSGKAGQQQRRRGGQRRGDAPFAAESLLQHQPVDGERLMAGGGEHERADGERQREGRGGGRRLRQARRG